MTVIHGAPPFAKKPEVAQAVPILAIAGIISGLEKTADARSKDILDKTVTTTTAIEGIGKALMNAVIEFDDAYKSFEKMAHPATQSLRAVLDPLLELSKITQRGDLDVAIKKLSEITTLIERMQKLQQDPEMSRLLKQIFGGNP